MPDNPIPERIRQFILGSIDSVVEVEALILLCSAPEPAWNAPALAHRLYIPEREAAALLGRLCDKGLAAALADPGGYVYRPASAEIDELARGLLGCYSRHLVAVSQLIHSRPDSRIREFADAFKFRKD